MRKRFRLAACALVASLFAFGIPSAAQPLSDKPIRLVVPYAPGGIADTMARRIGESMGQHLKQAVVIENKPGGNTVIGAMAVAAAAPDGHTLLLATGATVVLNPMLNPTQTFKPEKDLTGVASVAATPLVITASANGQVSSLAELVSLAKAQPGKIAFASTGNGATTHLAMELLQSAAGISLNHVPYNGSAPALNAVAGGTVDLSIDSVASALPLIQGGRLKALAVTTRARLPQLPDVPTVAEAVSPGFDVSAWYGIVAPARTPPQVIDTLNAAINKALADKSVREPLEAQGLLVAKPAKSSDFNEMIGRERGIWGPLITAKKIRVE